MKTICYFLGLPQLSIEGYFNTKQPHNRPLIVDIDLPFDKAFFKKIIIMKAKLQILGTRIKSF